MATLFVGAGLGMADPDKPAPFLKVKVDGAINPVVSEFLIDAIHEAEERGVQALIVEIDTPGGLDEAMRKIIKEMLNTPAVVIVFVSPSGARAASAGAIITLAADVAAMAPGTNIGAAHPVAMGGGMDETMEKKVVNDAVAYVKGIARKKGRNEKWAEEAVRESVSISAEEARKKKVVELVAADVKDLLEKLDGRKVEKLGEKIVLHTAGAVVETMEMDFRQRLLDTLSNPNIAYILMMIGVWGLFFELTNPGVIFPGVIGGICLLMGLYSLQTLPLNYAGFGLIGLAIVFFIMEVKVASYGLLTVAGLISMALGSMMLIKSPGPFLELSNSVVFGTVGATGLIVGLVMLAVVRAQRSRTATGQEALVGMVGRAVMPVSPEGGKIFVHGEYWNAVSREPVEEGRKIKVVAVEGLLLKVTGA